MPTWVEYAFQAYRTANPSDVRLGTRSALLDA